ncbi:MAG: hypothetical protein IH593_04155, partial [Bacteroidales bacterium]|nr:hypothetical protein [Bacteroidales bacterium]
MKGTLLIKEEQTTGGIPNMEQIFSGTAFNPWPNLDDEVAILESYTLNQRVIEEIPELQVACVPVNRRGIQGQRQYMTTPFIMQKITDEQPFGVSMTIRFTGAETFTLEVDQDELKTWRENEQKESKIKEQGTIAEGQLFHLGEPITAYGFNFKIEQRDTSRSVFGDNNRYLVWFESPSSLVNSYRAGLKVEAVKEGATVFTLSFDGYSPQQGADYLNTLMRLFIIRGVEWKNRAADNTIKFIETQLGLVSDSLRLAENTMENFRLNNRFVDLTLEGTLVLERLEKYEGEKNVLGLQMQYYKYLLDYLEAHDESETIISPSVMGVSDPVLVGLVNEYATLQQQKKQMAFTVRDNLPQAKLVDQNIEDARMALHENVSSAINQLKLSINTVDSR